MIAYILAKDEEANIGRCVREAIAGGLSPIVLDSGSRDRTVELSRLAGARVEPFDYRDHCTAYNEITTSRCEEEACVILDADMIVSGQLVREVKAALASFEVVKAPVTLCCEGVRLRFASLYPPKPVGFRAGKAYFVPAGHGEQLRDGVRWGQTRAALVHDDRKPFSRFLESQGRYAAQFATRLKQGKITWRDRIRYWTPLGALAAPAVILVLRLGFLDGKAGLVYCLDRMIAELVMYRSAVASRLRRKRQKKQDFLE